MTIELFQKKTHIDFVGKRYLVSAISLIIIIASTIIITLNGGLVLGVDFTGGTTIQISFEEPIENTLVKSTLTDLNLPELTIQRFSEDNKTYIINFLSTNTTTETIKNQILQTLYTKIPNNKVTFERLEMVGPKVGTDLRNTALEALCYSVLLISVYISGRFEHRWMTSGIMAITLGSIMYFMGTLDINMSAKVLVVLLATILFNWKLKLNFAFGAIIGLLYDIIITIGILSIMGKEFDLNILAALLTLIGYSLNDTIIVYDRIRENIQNQNNNTNQSLAEIINTSINQTLGRTIMTSSTTLLTVLSLFLLGGSVIHGFALTMLIGIIIGTFSSIFVASPILLIFGDIHHYISRPKDDNYKQINEHGVV